MEYDPTGQCPYCKTNHDVDKVSDQEAEIIAEDAQDPADYYTLVEHKTLTGERCEGSGKTPAYLNEPYVDTDHDDPLFEEPSISAPSARK